MLVDPKEHPDQLWLDGNRDMVELLCNLKFIYYSSSLFNRTILVEKNQSSKAYGMMLEQHSLNDERARSLNDGRARSLDYMDDSLIRSLSREY